jgi:two-component system sensor histidine kinase HydH
MNVQSLPSLLAAIVTVTIAVAVLLRDHQQRPHRLFSVLCFVVSAWHLSRFFYATFRWEVFYYGSLFIAVAVPVAASRFFRAFLADERYGKGARTVTPRSIATMALGFSAVLAYTIALQRYHPLHHAWGFVLPLFGYVFFGLYSAMISLYNASRRTLARMEKARLRYLLLGGIAAITLEAADFLPTLGIPFPAMGTIATLVYFYFIFQTLFRYRLLDLNEQLGRMAVMAVFVLLIAAIYNVLVAWVPTDQSELRFFNTLVASFVILILFDPLRKIVEASVQRWMFREKYELRKRVEGLRIVLANVIDIRDAVRLTIATLEESRRVTHSSLYLVDTDGAGYDLLGHLGPRPTERIDAAARRPFFERLASARTVSIEQLEREHARRIAAQDGETETVDSIARTLDELQAALVIPILADDQVLGLLCLKDERLREAYATDEIDLFRGLAAQIAVTIQNSKLYDRMKERDRLAAIGEMAAGLAHEIRNPLGAIKGAAQLLQPAAEGKESNVSESREFLSIIVEEANRLNRVVSQFLDYARPLRGEPAPFDLNEVVRKTAQLLSQSPPANFPNGEGDQAGENAAPPVEIGLSLTDDLPRGHGDAEQLRQVFLNLALNGMQAMPYGGKLTISTGLRKGARGSASTQLLEIRFRDSGHGIAPADLKSLFIPFFTTKEKGTGLGLPISQRIIENHGGTIEVRSRVGSGSTFTVVLPVHEVDHSQARPSS